MIHFQLYLLVINVSIKNVSFILKLRLKTWNDHNLNNIDAYVDKFNTFPLIFLIYSNNFNHKHILFFNNKYWSFLYIYTGTLEPACYKNYEWKTSWTLKTYAIFQSIKLLLLLKISKGTAFNSMNSPIDNVDKKNYIRSVVVSFKTCINNIIGLLYIYYYTTKSPTRFKLLAY